MRDLSDLQPSLRTGNLLWTRKRDLRPLADPKDPNADLVSVIEEAGFRRASRTLFEDRILNWDLTPVEHYAVAINADMSPVPGVDNQILRLTESTFTLNTLDANASAGVRFPLRVPTSGQYYFLWHGNFDVVNSDGGSNSVRFLRADNTTACLIGIDENTGGLFEDANGLLASNNEAMTPVLIELDADADKVYLRYLSQQGQTERVEAFSGDLSDTEIRMEVNRGQNTQEDLIFVFSANSGDVPPELSPETGFEAYPDPVQPRFPENARPSELLKVSVPGTFGGIEYDKGEGAIVSSLYPQEVISLKGPSNTVTGPVSSEARGLPVFTNEEGNRVVGTKVKIDVNDALFGHSKKYITHTEATLVLDPSFNGCRLWLTHQQGCVISFPAGVTFQKGFHIEVVQVGGIVTVDTTNAPEFFADRDTLETTGVGTAIGLSHIENDNWWGYGTGLDGLSAYQVAVANGFEGSASDWLDALQGADGIGIRILGSLTEPSDLPLEDNANGDAYIIQQVMWVYDGSTWVVASQAGPRGKSAYQVAVDEGFEGNVNQWLESLKGLSAFQIAKAVGRIGPTVTEEEWLDTLKGDDAFLVAKADGFEGTRSEWLVSLRGEKGDRGDIGPKGDPAAAIKVLGEVASENDLPTGADPGDAYFIARNLWVWTSTEWFDAGEIVGPKGDKGDTGDKGDRGYNNYELAQQQGYPGTLTDWLNSLKGLSAYQVAVQQGVDLTPEEWLESLNGADGLDAYDTAVKYGFQGDYAAWVESIRGPRGFQGLKGDKGDEGQPGPRGYSNFEIAQQLGFEGDEADFLESQRGPRGFKGDQGDEGPEGPIGPIGPVGRGLEIDGVVQTVNDLPAPTVELYSGPVLSLNFATQEYLVWEADPVPEDFTTYIVVENAHLYYWANAQWNDAGQIVGPSAYKIAQEQGFEGNEQQWLESLVGQSAYALAIANGFIGTETEWLASLKGEKGDEGPPGPSNYDLAVDQGFEGTLNDYLNSLKGDKGDQGAGLVPKGPLSSENDLPATVTDGWVYTIGTHIWIGVEGAWQDQGDFSGVQGLSAFEVAKQVDPSLESEAQWAASLKGDQGDEGPEGPRGIPLVPMGPLNSTSELPATGGLNEMYIIDGHAWIWVIDDWKDHGDLRGPQGEDGPMGPGVRILGTVSSPAALPPSADNIGDGYLIDGYFYGWTDTGWENMGLIRGPQGERGPQGLRGLKGDEGSPGLKGDKGDKGTVWIALDRNPGVLDGRPNDYALNTVSLEYFLKTSETNWASLGHLGGGNVYDAPDDGVPYLRQNRDWKAFDHYTLPVATATDTLDLGSRNIFEVNVTEDRVLSFANEPQAGTAMTVAITLIGATGTVSWPGNIDWVTDAPPILGENHTIVVLFWTGSFWSGTVSVSK